MDAKCISKLSWFTVSKKKKIKLVHRLLKRKNKIKGKQNSIDFLSLS